ncbi:MAG: nuclear transport factor 2 family protein [Saonia sp.]
MDVKTLARDYLDYLQKGEIDKVIALFANDGLVVSPIYGTKPAQDFYTELANDTEASVLKFDGLFEEKEGHRVALSFDYHWTLKNGKKVVFKVVDIIVLDDAFKIKKLTIIYDTYISRELVKSL